MNSWYLFQNIPQKSIFDQTYLLDYKTKNILTTFINPQSLFYFHKK